MFISTLFVQALFALTTFATPTANEHLNKGITPSEVDALELPLVHFPQVNNTDLSPRVDTDDSAGVALVSVPGSYVGVTTQFSVPPVRPPTGTSVTSYVYAWVGLDAGASRCTNALQAGLMATVRNNTVTYDGWYRWIPAGMIFIPNVTFRANNEVSFTLRASNTTSALITVDNISTGEFFVQRVDGPALCLGDAEWLVQTLPNAPLPNFGDVTFTLAGATLTNGTVVGPLSDNAIVYNIVRGGTVFTETDRGGSSVTVRYTQ